MRILYFNFIKMVDRLEIGDSSEIMQESTSELFDLEVEIKDQDKFERILQDPDFQGACEKIFNQASNKALGEEWEKLNNIKVSDILKECTKNNMGLKLYIEAALGLKDVSRFENLTNEQKLKFLALNTALKTEKTTEDIVNKTQNLIEKYTKKVYNSFNWSHVKNLLDLEKTLQSCGLNKEEIQKYKEFIELVDKNETIKNKILEALAMNSAINGAGKNKLVQPCIAGWVAALLIALGAAALIGVGYLARWVQDLKNKPKEELHSFTTTSGMREILQRASYEYNTATVMDKELGVYELDEDAGLRERVRKGTVNIIQNKEVFMVVDGTVKAQFDLYQDGCGLIVNYDEYTNRFTYNINLPEPSLVTQDVSMHAKEHGRELIKLRDLDNIQGEMLEEGKELLKKQAEEQNIIPKAKRAIRNQMKSMIEEIINPICNENTPFTYEINIRFADEGRFEFPQGPENPQSNHPVVPQSFQLPPIN